MTSRNRLLSITINRVELEEFFACLYPQALKNGRHGIIVPGNKKSTFDRASFLPAELIDLMPFRGLFL